MINEQANEIRSGLDVRTRESQVHPGSRSSYWCATLNSYTEEDTLKIQELVRAGTASYAVIGKEIGESGNRHLQIYIEFPTRLRFSRVRSLLDRAHIEARHGTAQQACR